MKRTKVNNSYDYLEMYNAARANGIGGWAYWPIPFFAKRHFKIIEDKLTSDNEVIVFTFMARVDRNYSDVVQQGGAVANGMNIGGTNMPMYGSNDGYSNSPGLIATIFKLIGKLLGFLLNPILKPFKLNQMWMAFALTDRNKLYYAHSPFLAWSPDFGRLLMNPDDMRVDQNNTISDPIYGNLTFLSLKGDQKITLMWTQRALTKIYKGVSNNMELHNRKIEDEDGNVMY